MQLMIAVLSLNQDGSNLSLLPETLVILQILIYNVIVLKDDVLGQN